MRAWVVYTVVRVGIFLVAFGILYALTTQLGSWAWAGAAVIAALVSLCVSYIFLGRLRAQVATELAARRERRPAKAGSDEAAEDRVE